MSYQHISHQSYPPPPAGGYNPNSPIAAGFLTDPPAPPPPQPGPGGYNYRPGPPQPQTYGSYDYPYDTRRSPSFCRACLAALCCCCVFEECCINW